ncbi:hypothetical protein F0855_10790 [Escherichia coli]|nr:hypothetical protein [Escherichia coli]EEY6203288.1 hypothetical protein [Escherichia coli]EFB9531642.1 hypothetical protein [Escherichia coli]EFB9565919.1 hypothetical protein [Escherichia coli]EFC4061599.1 hypothetical protein [Escherichia coli]
MKTMLAAYLPGNSTVDLREVAVPTPGINQVLIKMKSSGIYSAAIFLIPICISFDTAEKRRYATYLILNRRFSFEF